MLPSVRVTLYVGAALLVGLGGGYWWAISSNASLANTLRTSLLPIQQNSGVNTLVHPLLGYKTPEATTYGEYVDLNVALEADISQATQSKNVLRAAVYFRDLDTARWIGVNQADSYHPASLLKVPILMAYLKEAETEPAILTKRVVYAGVELAPYDTASALTAGSVYSINQLLEYMVVNSDNGATSLLLQYIDPNLLNAAYTALGIPDPGDDSSQYQISARTYGLFFRILYNATYLSPASSEKALELLSKATFADGLVAGLPKGIAVAHKFGQHVVTDVASNPTGVELSDCGVVYYPGHPYLLCVMTSAVDTPTAARVISTLSKTTYDAIVKQYPVTVKE